MTEKEQLILEMNRLNDMLDPLATRNDYGVFLKIKRVLELIMLRLDETEQ